MRMKRSISVLLVAVLLIVLVGTATAGTMAGPRCKFCGSTALTSSYDRSDPEHQAYGEIIQEKTENGVRYTRTVSMAWLVYTCRNCGESYRVREQSLYSPWTVDPD